MTKLADFIQGISKLEEVESPFNGKITVVKSLAWGTYFQVDGLTQSGGVLYEVWKTTLNKLKNGKTKRLKNCLILGLGGGSAAKLVRKFWPGAEITGVDIDSAIVDLGKKYLGLEKSNVKIIIKDAIDFLTTSSKLPAAGYDLILVDLYRGDEFPKKFEQEGFLKQVHRLLSRGAVAVFNRLYLADKRRSVMDFGKKLEKVFKKVDYFYPEANLMFICSK